MPRTVQAKIAAHRKICPECRNSAALREPTILYVDDSRPQSGTAANNMIARHAKASEPLK